MRTVLLLLLFCPAIAHAWPATVMSVTDGDTLRVAPCGDRSAVVAVRLYGIDAPEKDQTGGIEAGLALKALAPVGTEVEIVPMDFDHYGRVVGLLMANGVCANTQMIETGHAWVYERYCQASMCRGWRKSQELAIKRGQGLWSESKALPPWEWRKK